MQLLNAFDCVERCTSRTPHFTPYSILMLKDYDVDRLVFVELKFLNKEKISDE